jgi:hypothetical protein
MTKAEILKKHKMTEQEFYQKYPTQEAYMKEFGEGGSIHIKPENRGKFTAYKQRTGKTTEEALHSPNAHVRQMANFARNAAKWKHADGGMMKSSRITPEITRLDNGGQMNYYNNKINRENALATGLLQTGLGLAGIAIGGPAGGMVGSSLGSAVGKLFDQGGPLTKYDGLTHAEGGIALGNTGNEVEDKETRVGDFIFSEQLKYKNNQSYADMSKKIEKQTIGRRDNDKISRTTFDRKIGALAEKQEVTKAINNKTNTVNKFAFGTDDLSGTNPYSNPYRDNSYLLPYQSDIKSSFMDIPSGINTPVEQPNNSRYNFEPIEPKNPIPIIESYAKPDPLKPIKPKSAFLPYSPTWPLTQETELIKKKLPPLPKDVKEPVEPKAKTQMDLSWLNPALQMGLSSLGNYKPLTVKNYQMRPDLMDSTQAKRENRDMFSSINSDMATSGLTGGQYLASRMGTASQMAGENAKIDNTYRAANVGIKNQFRQMNTATDKEVQELNAREIDASKTAKQFRNQNMASIIGGVGQEKGRQSSVIPEGHIAIKDKWGKIIGYKRIN